MQLRILDNITPESYGIPGAYSWPDTVQWHKGDVLEAGVDIEREIAESFVENGDAEWIEDCPICGENHEGNVPWGCETGDGY